jgi:hypothetical protein
MRRFCILFFVPFPNPSKLYPTSWFRDFIFIEKEINKIIRKLIHIVEI